MAQEQELQHWTKAERYFAKATPEQTLACAKWYLFIIGHNVPCRCSDESYRLLEGIEHADLFGILRSAQAVKVMFNMGSGERCYQCIQAE